MKFLECEVDTLKKYYNNNQDDFPVGINFDKSNDKSVKEEVIV